MSGHAAGGNDAFDASSPTPAISPQITFYGDVGGTLSDNAHGGNDTFTANVAHSNLTFYGDAGSDMSGRATGGNDTFIASGLEN
jgi:hypothetical protein